MAVEIVARAPFSAVLELGDASNWAAVCVAALALGWAIYQPIKLRKQQLEDEAERRKVAEQAEAARREDRSIAISWVLFYACSGAIVRGVGTFETGIVSEFSNFAERDTLQRLQIEMLILPANVIQLVVSLDHMMQVANRAIDTVCAAQIKSATSSNPFDRKMAVSSVEPTRTWLIHGSAEIAVHANLLIETLAGYWPDAFRAEAGKLASLIEGAKSHLIAMKAAADGRRQSAETAGAPPAA